MARLTGAIPFTGSIAGFSAFTRRDTPFVRLCFDSVSELVAVSFGSCLKAEKKQTELK